MTEKRFMVDDAGTLIDITTRNTYDYVSDVCPLLNEMDNELLNCRAENTKLKLLLKDIVNDLKRMNTKGYGEHIEMLVNLDFKGVEWLNDIQSLWYVLS